MRRVGIAAALGLCIACAAGESAPAPPAYVEIRTAGAEEGAELPLIVAMHGRGDRAERFARVFDGLEVPARIALLRAPIREGDGDAWFTFRRPHTWQNVADDLDAVSDRVLATIDAITRARRTRGRPIAVGFSQGAMLAYTLAVRHGPRFAAAIPISGLLVEETLRRDRIVPDRMPPIVALHGTRDEVIPIDADRDAIGTLTRAGARVELRAHDATHWVDGAMQRDLVAQLGRLLAEAP